MNTYIHEELYRGKDLFEKIESVSLTICGCGAIGSNLTENLVRQGFKGITVVDFDRVEDHNRHTQIWGRRDVGQLKTRAIHSRMYNDSGTVINGIAKRLDASNAKKIIGKDSLVVDSFDNSESREVIYDFCKSNRVECLHIGLNEGYAEVIWNDRYRFPDNVEGLDVCEYPLARNIVMLSVIVGTEVILRYLESGEKRNYQITLGDLKIKEFYGWVV